MISDLRKETGQNYASWYPSDMFVGLVSPHVFLVDKPTRNHGEVTPTAMENAV